MNQDRASTITNSQLKEGYKQTEVGVIPEDWSATNLGKFMMLQRGYDLPHRERKIGDIPIITSSGFGGTHSESKALAPGVVTGRYGTIGDVFYVQEDFWPLNTTLYVKNFYGNNPLFASYLLKTIDFHSHSGKSGVPGVNRNDLHELIIRIPPLAEQEAIAHTLSDIDALIESLDRLLTKKRQIKQGAMQELLRSKDGWVDNRLGDIATFINGRAYSINEWETTGTPVIRLQNLTGRGEDYYYSNFNLPEKQYCEKGDLLFMWSATFGPIIWNGSKAIYHYHIWKVECHQNKLYKDFFYHLLADMTEKLKSKSSSGGTMLHLTKTGMNKMMLKVPSLKEQIEIANILSDMDAEIGSIESKLTKTRQLKQGMMHELLTGRIRLVDPSQGKS
jgi:type I restriction enzyme, S subunit